jgi:hypothetical protein
MTRHAGETWVFRVEVPPGVRHGGRFVARILKHLLRTWGVKCTAVLEAPPEESAHACGEKRTCHESAG